jgi:hypothetical protein
VHLALHSLLVDFKKIKTTLSVLHSPSETMGRAGGLLAATVALGAAAVFAVWRRKRDSKGSASSSSSFDKLDTIVLSNQDGVEVHITPVGASIKRLVVPVKGSKLDVVLGFNKASTYAVSGECKRIRIVTKHQGCGRVACGTAAGVSCNDQLVCLCELQTLCLV